MSPAAPHLLTRSPRRTAEEDKVRLLGPLALARSRVHEICGPARRTLALLLAATSRREVYWIAPAWVLDRLNGDGIAEFVEPGRIVFVTPHQAGDLLWCAEEALRSGVVPLVVVDVPDPPSLTPIRRLHLAAEAGSDRETAPLGLVLTPEGAAPGVESRWSFSQAPNAWLLERQKARTAAPRTWHIAHDRPAPVGEITRSQARPDVKASHPNVRAARLP